MDVETLKLLDSVVDPEQECPVPEDGWRDERFLQHYMWMVFGVCPCGNCLSRYL
jgi:hypothetical protein